MLLTDFGELIAERMRAEHQALAARWFERLLDLLPVEARDVFPTDDLLDHVPGLILEIADSLDGVQDDAVAASSAILEKARELGALRHGQRASLHQVLREYQILGGVLVNFVLEEMDRQALVPEPSATVRVVSRLHHAVDVLSQATVESFVTLYTDTITEQSERLEQFTRMAAHEWRQPLATLQFGITLLRQSKLDEAHSRRTLESLDRNVARLASLTLKLESLARMHHTGDNPIVQEVPAATLAQEAARQLREMSDRHGVDVRVSDDMPIVTVDVGRLELVLVNLLSNAIKYSNPAKAPRYVDVHGRLDGDHWWQLEVRDNGLGIPNDALGTIFNRFTRAHVGREEVHASGMGLGLAIVDDCVRAMGGRVDVQSVEGEGTTFIVRLPVRPHDRR